MVYDHGYFDMLCGVVRQHIRGGFSPDGRIKAIAAVRQGLAWLRMLRELSK